MTILDHFYTTPAAALEKGFTHHGFAYGVPVYIDDFGDGMYRLRAKVTLFQPFIRIADRVADHIAAWALRDQTDPDAYVDFENLLRIGRRIAS